MMVTLPGVVLRSSWMLLDKAAKRRDAKAAGNQRMSWPRIVLEREATPERPANTHDVAALHLVQRPVKRPARRTHS